MASEKQAALPKHIAIIMDGNGRWAKQRHQPRFMGHRAGVKAVEESVRACAEKGIEVLSLFAFSSENWRRPSKEVSLLMEMFKLALKKQVPRLQKRNIRLRIVGDISRFSDSLQQHIQQAEKQTEQNTGLTVVIAANYGGRWDITQSVRQLASRVAKGELKPEQISEEMIGASLCCPDLPEPDLFIRTGGEQRISNFMLWQLAYTEFYFTDILWPDFNRDTIESAIQSFTTRERRFGKTSEQLKEDNNA